MGTIFNKEIEKAKKLSGYNKQRASRLLDDMATAYLSTEFDGLDKSLIAVKTAKKAMRAQGIKQDIIDDYFLQRSYLSKTTLRSLVNESIYTGDSITVNPIIENRVASHSDKTTTDLIIDELHNRPALLNALRKNIHIRNLERTYNVKNAQLLKNFYNKYHDIIEQ